MKLLKHLEGRPVQWDIQLDKPFQFTPQNLSVSFNVDAQNKQLERLVVHLGNNDHVILWPLREHLQNDLTTLFKEEINRFIQEEITSSSDMQDIVSYVKSLLTDPNFKPLREIEGYFSGVLKYLMKKTAIQFINEHMAYNMPQIKQLDEHNFQFEGTIYHHPIYRTLTVLQSDDEWSPIGKVSLTFNTKKPAN